MDRNTLGQSPFKYPYLGLRSRMGTMIAAAICIASIQTTLHAQTAPPVADKAASKAAKEQESKLLKSKDYFLRKEDPGKYEKIARQKREEAIVLLKGILDSGNVSGDQLAEMNMRLAELYWETAKDKYLDEMASYLVIYGKWAESNDTNRGVEPKANHLESQRYNRLAIDLYRYILQSHQSFGRMDEVYFNLGFNLMDLGEKDQSLEYYQTLVKNYPQSNFVADAYLAIGEHYFDNNNAFKALGNYKKAATFKDAKVQVFALYKLGWCYYNVGEYTKAIDSMKDVISFSALDATQLGTVSLREEALRDLVLFYSELGDMDAAYQYFAQFGEKKHYMAMLKRLAGIYLEQGKFDQSISTYRKLIAEDPTARDNPSHQNEIIGAYFRSGRKDDTIAEIDRLSDVYGSGSKWASANKDNASALEEANDLIEKNLRQVAIDYHKEARKTASKKTYELAERSYEKYLKLFPSNKLTYDIRFAYAEVLYELRQYEKAVDEYERVVKLDTAGKYVQVAASSMILTIDKILGIDSKSKEAAGTTAPNSASTPEQASKNIEPVALAPWEQRKVNACDLYVATLPTHKDAAATLYEGAHLLYDKKQFNESTPRFLKIVEKYGDQDVAEVAANLVLDSYNQRQDWDNLDKYGRLFYAHKHFSTPFKNELMEIYERAAFKKLEPLEKAEKFKEAADGYLAFYQEFPKSTLSDRALFNAAVYVFRLGDVRKSVTLREKLLAEFSNSELTGKNIEALGKIHEAFADYNRAGDYYEKLAAWDNDRDYPGTVDALYNAGLFRDSLGQWEKSVANYTAYFQAYRDRDDAEIVALEVGRIYERNAKWPEALATYKKLYSDPTFGKAQPDNIYEARIRYGKVLQAQGKKADAIKHFQESVAAFDKAVKAGTTFNIAPLFIAEMRFYMVEPLYDRFAILRIELPKKGQKPRNALEEKVKLMEQVITAYTDVLQLKQGEWGIAALCQIGSTYRNLADTLLSAPIPAALTEQQAQLFHAALEDQAFPLKDKAAEALEQALAKSYELGIYNAFTATAATYLAELRPKEYPVLAERLGVPDRLTSTHYTADFLGQ